MHGLLELSQPGIMAEDRGNESYRVNASQCESRVEHRRTLEIIIEHSSYIGHLVYK
jgi:hypothetical protein